MNKSELILAKVYKILNELSEVELRDITPSMSITDDLEFDSLALIKLLLKTEEEFSLDIDFDNFEFEIFDSISSFTEFIEKAINADEV